MRGNCAGGTDYRHQSFEDIVADLDEMGGNFCRWGVELTRTVTELVRDGYWDSVPQDFRAQVGRTLKLLDTACGELCEIAKDVRREVREDHVTRLRSLAQTADELNRVLGQVWHADYMNRFKNPQYGQARFMTLEGVYGDGRSSVATLLDLDRMGTRLAEFVGRREILSWRDTVTRALAKHAVAIIVTVVGGILLAVVLGILRLAA